MKKLFWVFAMLLLGLTVSAQYYTDENGYYYIYHGDTVTARLFYTGDSVYCKNYDDTTVFEYRFYYENKPEIYSIDIPENCNSIKIKLMLIFGDLDKDINYKLLYCNQNGEGDTIVYSNKSFTKNYKDPIVIDTIYIDANYISNGKLYYKNLYKDSTASVKKDFTYIFSKVEITPIINQDTIETAIEDIGPDDFEIVDRFVRSEGKIVVYNVNGQVVTTAIETLDINTLSNGVYIIKANEGTIKFIK